MTHGRSDEEIIRGTHNAARFFVEKRHIAWILLVVVVLWGVYGYVNMPKRKDPDIPVRVAVAITQWPGVSAEKVEQLVTRPVEERIAQNTRIHQPEAGNFGIKSISLPGVSFVQVQLEETGADTRKEFSDIALKLNDLNRSLPQGAGPIQFNSDYGETAALMLTIASPVESPVVVGLRARAIARAIQETRARGASGPGARVAVVVAFSELVSPTILEWMRDLVARQVAATGLATDCSIPPPCSSRRHSA